jgi:hypothetical protein
VITSATFTVCINDIKIATTAAARTVQILLSMAVHIAAAVRTAMQLYCFYQSFVNSAVRSKSSLAMQRHQ